MEEPNKQPSNSPSTDHWWWPPTPEAGDTGDPAPRLEEVTLRDGTTAWLRPLLPGDAEPLREGYRGLSRETKYNRFLSPTPELTDFLLRILVDEVDGVDHLAYVVFVEGADVPAGIGRIRRDPVRPHVADVAITVHDEWRRRGIGSILHRVLHQRRPAGVTTLQTIVAEGNLAPLALSRHCADDVEVRSVEGAVEFVVHLRGAARADDTGTDVATDDAVTDAVTDDTGRARP